MLVLKASIVLGRCCAYIFFANLSNKPPFLTLSFPSTPGSHSCHWGSGLSWVIFEIFYLASVNYDPLSKDLIVIRVNSDSGQKGRGDWPSQVWIANEVTEINSPSPPPIPHQELSGNYLEPLMLTWSLFTLGLNYTILAEVTISLLGRTALFWIESRLPFKQGHSAFAWI